MDSIAVEKPIAEKAAAEPERLNTAPKWKRIYCFILLFFYFSSIPVVLNFPPLSILFDIMEFALVIVMAPQLGKEFKKIGKKPSVLLFILVGAVMRFGIEIVLWDNIIIKMIKDMTGIYPENANTVLMMDLMRESPLWILGGCVFGPVVEELLYRYTAFGVLYEKNKFAAYTVTALLFGIQHIALAGIWGGDVTQFMNIGSYMIFSIIMSFLFAKTKTLSIPIIVHILFNVLGVLYMLNQ